MEDFIGNNAKFIVTYGQLISIGVILMSAFLLFLLCKNSKFFLPKGFFKIIGSIILVILIVMSGLVLIKVTTIKPRMQKVIVGLESLKNKPTPSLEFYLLSDESKRNMTDYQGNVVLLNYWATWCAPCIKEMPELNRLQETYFDQGLVVIALSDEPREKILKFADKRPFIVTAAYTNEFDWADIQTERPITFLINEKGIIVDYFTGGYNYEYFESKILGQIK